MKLRKEGRRYTLELPNGRNGRFGVSLNTYPFEPRHDIARRLWQARRELKLMRDALGVKS